MSTFLYCFVLKRAGNLHLPISNGTERRQKGVGKYNLDLGLYSDRMALEINFKTIDHFKICGMCKGSSGLQ